MDYIRSCTTCHQNKSIHHKPFGPYRFLPVAIQPWDSISMDFMEGLPLSEGYDTILVIICQLLKMGLFIPTVQGIWRSLCQLLDIKANLSYLLPTIPRPMARPNKSTKSLNNIFAFSSTTSRMTGSTCYPLQSLPTTTLSIRLQVSLHFSQIRVSTHNLKYLSNQFLLKVLMSWHQILRNCTSTSVNSFNA